MKIALFVPTITGGGAEKMQVHLANGLADRGHSVELVIANAEAVARKRLSVDVRLIDFQKPRIMLTLLPLRRYLRKERPDVLIAALSHANVLAIVARLLAPLCGTKVIVTERNTIAGWIASGRQVDQMMPTLMKLLYPLAYKIVGVSQGVSDEVREVLGLQPSKVSTIYNPIITPDIADQIPRPTCNPLFDKIERPIVVTAGRLVPLKDHEGLISAFVPIANDRKANLVILGEGPMRQQLETAAAAAGIAGQVHFLGFVENLMAYLARADLFVLNSKHEGLANVLVEALACGLPIVSTDCPSGPREVLDNGRYGRLVSVGDTKGLSAAMLEALDSSTNIESLQARAKDFSVDKIANQYEALFQ